VAAQRTPGPTPVSGPVVPSAPTPRAASGEDVVAELWPRILHELEAAAPKGSSGLRSWLDRIEPVLLREGTLELVTRSPHAAPLLRERVLPLLERAARRVVGSPIRVRIDVDQSLGGALHALGLKTAPLPPRPPAFLPQAETRLAHAALVRLAREPRPEFDQVVIEGPAGVGKSLLLATFHHQRRRRFPRECWRTERAEAFFRDFAAACRDHARASFRGERVACDGFLLDDVQELAGKLACQETLVEMLEYFRARGRPVAIATAPLSGGPREFLPQLRSLLRRGLRLTIPQLSAAARGEILAARAREAGFTRLLPDSAAWFDELAQATEAPLSQCLREIEQAGALARELGRAPRRDELEAALPSLSARARGPEPFDRVLDRCAAFVGVPRESLVAGARTRGAALGRHLAVYLALEIFRLQRTTVRRWLGALSPSVLPYAKAKIEALRTKDRRLDGFIREIAEEIGRGQRFLFG
jgi:chromosomal replication initiation ATPase DnaA